MESRFGVISLAFCAVCLFWPDCALFTKLKERAILIKFKIHFQGSKVQSYFTFLEVLPK